MTSGFVKLIHTFTLGGAVAVALAVATPVTAPLIANDADGDGVADVIDACPDTPRLDLVDGTGCSVCPCDAAWSSHDAYVSCVSEETRRRRALGLLGSREARAALVHAKDSTCGDPTLTRCCVYRKPVLGSAVSCKLMVPERCSYAVLGRWAENLGPGSCSPNPCPP